MNNQRSIFSILLIFIAMGIHANTPLKIGLGGNAYVTKNPEGAKISDRGLTNWDNPKSVITVYFYIENPSIINVSLVGKGNSEIKLSCNGSTKRVFLNSATPTTVEVGMFNIKRAGYVSVNIQGDEKTGDTFGEISELLVQGVNGKSHFVTDFSNYWGRRGPSVHLAYTLPKGDTEWFYTEVTVPRKGEVMHSYYMAAGFGEGYFGMQYNSETERRVLFSVWSPFDTQDPKQIPDEDRIKLLRRGEDVHIGEFGNEGSGGQSYLKYDWKAGRTYPFLMRVRPTGKGDTEYTAYFYATDEKRWRLIASFSRPKTNTWYKRPHSFLENFSPEMGYQTRMAYYDNQWARSKEGKWTELTDAVFTYDATAAAGVRSDYQGGERVGRGYFLRMGGFFSESTDLKTKFSRPLKEKMPKVDFDELESIYRDSSKK